MRSRRQARLDLAVDGDQHIFAASHLVDKLGDVSFDLLDGLDHVAIVFWPSREKPRDCWMAC